MSNTVKIEQNIIYWAINRAGYDINVFFSENPEYEKWFRGQKEPTIKQLEKFSHKLHVPFGYLLLKTPPEEIVPIPFYRSINSSNNKTSINVFDTIQILQRRQEWLKEYLIENGHETLEFVGKYDINTSVDEIVNDIRFTLQLTDNWASKFHTWEEALNYLTQQIENIGVVINFNGVVQNNTHRPIDVNECRGFVLVDEIAPFMFVNNADAKAAQLFTLIHELAHIWLGHSAGFNNLNMLPTDDPIEVLCDKIAAEFLVPSSMLIEVWDEYHDIKRTARFFKVSPIVIARRILDLGIYSRQKFYEFYDNYMEEFRQKKERMGSGGDFYSTAKKRISLVFAAHISNAVKTNQLLYRDAYRLTGLKGDTFNKFLANSL